MSPRKAGFIAHYDSDCHRCGDLIRRGITRVTLHRERVIHVECASGWGDE